MLFVEDHEGTGIVVLQCTEAEVRFLNAPGSMFSHLSDDALNCLTWFYTPGRGAFVRLEPSDICQFLKLKPTTPAEQRFQQLLWLQVPMESVMRDFACA
jgi:hypothetical protein